ncbi:transposase [Kitasatospora sp. NPDC088346]|uniref:transposase n=1 Tax=Kitasatospora sp. NPDC088346 TaxID=3364073 RepID=UPI0037FAA456
MWVRDRLDGLWHDEDFAGRYPHDGRPGHSPAQWATVCVLQFLLGLSDRQAAEAVRCPIDFTYALVRHEAPRPGRPGSRARSARVSCDGEVGAAEQEVLDRVLRGRWSRCRGHGEWWVGMDRS